MLGSSVFARLRAWRKHTGDEEQNSRKATAVHAVERTQRTCTDLMEDPIVAPQGIAGQSTTVPTLRRVSLSIVGIPMPMNMPADKALASLVRSMEKEPSIQQQQAQARIRMLFRASTPETIQTLIDASLGDLNTLLFAGKLTDRIPVVWKPMPAGQVGLSSRSSENIAGKGGTLTIILSIHLIPDAAHDPAFVWGTLIHELLHCYALIMSPGNEICRCGEQVAHGPGFHAAATTAVKVLGIGRLGVGDVVDFDMGLCHADHDELLMREWAILKEEYGLCELPEVVQSEIVGWWEGMEGM